MASILHTALVWVESSKYILLFLGAFFEGPVVMISAGFLFRLGQLAFLPMYLGLVLGDFTADVAWYCLGRFGARATIFKYGRIINLTPAVLEKVETSFRKHHQKIFIISKLTMGLGFAAVIFVVAGIFKTPFKNFVILNLIGGLIWTAILLTLGYFFGDIYSTISGPAKIVFAGVALVVVIFGIRFANGYLKTKEI